MTKSEQSYQKLADGCCHKTVLERCEDCSFRDPVTGTVGVRTKERIRIHNERLRSIPICPICKEETMYPCNTLGEADYCSSAPSG